MGISNKVELRQSWMARTLRRYLYYLFVGKDDWPISFEAPEEFQKSSRQLVSSNLYVHLPFCERICYYCPYVKFRYDDLQHQQYSTLLLKEIETFVSSGQARAIESLYFGGGTPSLSIDVIEKILRLLHPYLSENSEIAIELHPSHCTSNLFDQLKELGVNKISIGVETFSPALLHMLGRRYSPEDAENALIKAKQVGFDCVDINLLYALPEQKVDDVIFDVNKAISLGVDQISAYPLFAFRHTSEGRAIKDRPDGLLAIVQRIRIQKAVSILCLQHHYLRTSVWSFARPGVKPYTTVTRENYRGFGVGAGTKIDGLFWFNTFSLQDYISSTEIEPILMMRPSERFQRFHWLYWRIYSTSIDSREYRRLYGRRLEQDYKWLLLWMRLLGWVERNETCWKISERGAIFAHLFQSLFSLSYIDTLWTRCQADARPKCVTLE